jgi:hypothetical protein
MTPDPTDPGQSDSRCRGARVVAGCAQRGIGGGGGRAGAARHDVRAIAWDWTAVWTGPLLWVPIMGGGGLLLVLAVVGWPLAAGVRRIRQRRLDRPRLDGALRVGMLAGATSFVRALGALMLGLPRGVSLVVPTWPVLLMMFFLSVTVAAVVPGLVLVVRSVRAHRGWVSTGSASAVTLGLVLVTIPVLSQHMLKFWDVTS